MIRLDSASRWGEMLEQQPTAPNVALAQSWAVALVVAYAIIPVLFFVLLLFFPQSRDDALMTTGEVYLGNLWLLGLAYVGYHGATALGSMEPAYLSSAATAACK